MQNYVTLIANVTQPLGSDRFLGEKVRIQTAVKMSKFDIAMVSVSNNILR